MQSTLARCLALSISLAGAARADGESEALSAPWRTVAPGVEVASAADLGGDPSWAARVVLVDPARARFAVRFDPEAPTLEQWRARFPEALAISVGSFFSADKTIRPTCDLVSEGRQVKGAGCRRDDSLWFGAQPKVPIKGEVLAAKVPALGRPPAPPRPQPERKLTPRLLSASEFNPDQWTEALKSFPTLVHAGYPACVGNRYCTDVSRSAAIAQLRDGRIVLFASQWPAVRKDVARFLAETLGAEEAVNLDGGPEAALAIRGEPLEQAVGGRAVPLPFVLLVLPN